MGLHHVVNIAVTRVKYSICGDENKTAMQFGKETLALHSSW
jgi:hypothetical protein